MFGSQAKGVATKNSDIAVIVRKIGKGEDYVNNKILLKKLSRNLSDNIEPILLEEKDLKKGSRSIMGYEVKEHGILIK